MTTNRKILSPSSREKLRAMIRLTKPWLFTRGPSTSAGKAIAKMNAYKHGQASKVGKLHKRMQQARAAYLEGRGTLEAWKEVADAWEAERWMVRASIARRRQPKDKGAEK